MLGSLERRLKCFGRVLRETVDGGGGRRQREKPQEIHGCSEGGRGDSGDRRSS